MQQNETTERCAGLLNAADPQARTMVLLFSAEDNKMQQLYTFVASCCIEPWLGGVSYSNSLLYQKKYS